MSTKTSGQIDPKRRIFNAACSLFVNKGFEAVGVREIAKEANVNLAMINYYFGGKAGILKDILEESYQKYYQAQASAGDDTTPPEERVRNLVHNVVTFFRANKEVALITFNSMLFDIPEIHNIKEKWGKMNYSLMNGLFNQMGVNLADQVHASIYNGFLGNMIKNHFQQRYAWDKMSEEQKNKIAESAKEVANKFEFDDLFYERFTDLLVNQYFHGVIYATQKDKMKYGQKETVNT